jgi:hypothetical protein
MENSMTPSGIEPATFRVVAQYLIHCATAVPIRLPSKSKADKPTDNLIVTGVRTFFRQRVWFEGRTWKGNNKWYIWSLQILCKLYSTDHVRNEDVLLESTKRGISYVKQVNGRPTRLVTFCVWVGIEVTGRRGRRRRKLLDDLKERILSFEGGSSRSHYVDSSIWKRLWTCRKAWLNERTWFTYLVAGRTVQSCGPWVGNTCFK